METARPIAARSDEHESKLRPFPGARPLRRGQWIAGVRQPLTALLTAAKVSNGRMRGSQFSSCRLVLSSVLDLGSMLGKSANGLFGLTLHFRFPRRSQWGNETPVRPICLQASSRLQSLTSIDSKEHYPFEA